MFTRKIKIAIFIVMIMSGVVFVFSNLNKKNNADNNNAWNELKKIHPELSNKQIKVFNEIAGKDKKEIFACLKNENKEKCIASVAFMRGDKDLCYTHNEGLESEKDEAVEKCVDDVLRKSAIAETGKCNGLDGDNFFNCLKNIFLIYENRDDCKNLFDAGARMICEDIFNYEDAYLRYDRQFCVKIRNEKLNKYCLKNIN